MEDIARHLGDNLGGINSFRYIPISEVLYLSEAIEGKVCEPLTIKAPGRWYDFYATEGTMGFNEVKENSPHGDFYKVRLSGFVPKDRPELIHALNKMRNQKFIIDYTDNNGLRKIIGTIDEPLRLKHSFDTGADVPNRAGTSFEFYGDLRFPSPVYYI